MHAQKHTHNQINPSTYFLGLSVVIVGAFAIIALFASGVLGGTANTGAEITKAIVVGNTQYIDVTANGGYTPNYIEAQSNIATTLRITSLSAFDCSNALLIPKLNIRETLPLNQVKEIALGAQAAGTELIGTCSMGMYSFTMKFI